MKKFMKNLETELKKKNLSEEEIEEILADHEEMIKSAISEGLSDEELVEKFGDPEQLAEELSNMSEEKEAEEAKGEKVFKDVKENYEVFVKLINEDVEVYTHDANEIKVEYFGKKDIKRYIIEFNDNKLSIERPKSINIRMFSRDQGGRFDIYLPKNLKSKESLFKTVNGDIEINELNVNKVEIQATNGDLELKNIHSVNFKVHTVNGDIEISNSSCDDFNSSVISGDIEISGLTCKNDIYMNTVSGDIQIKDSTCQEATLKTISGDLEGKEFYPKEISLKSISGDIDIKNKDKSKEIKVKTSKSISGEVTIN